MKRILTILVALMMGMTVQVNGLQINASTIERKATTPQKRAPQSTPNDTNTWYGLPIITWEEYERANSLITNQQKQINKLSQDLLQIDPNAQKVSRSPYQAGAPDYAKALGNAKYIYIGEVHNTPFVKKEIKQLIEAIQTAHPSEKILLATEFLTTPHPLVNPLHENGKEWIIEEAMEGVPELATELQLDTLALEDEIVQLKQQNSILAKAASYYIQIDPSIDEAVVTTDPDYKDKLNTTTQTYLSMDPLLFWLNYLLPSNVFKSYSEKWKNDPESKQIEQEYAQEYGTGNAHYTMMGSALSDVAVPPIEETMAYAAAYGRLTAYKVGLSDWGVLQRNRQWAQRIKQVEKNYDVIIVWGGNAHFGRKYMSPSVPMLLNHPDAVFFSFWPLGYPVDIEGEVKNTSEQQPGFVTITYDGVATEIPQAQALINQLKELTQTTVLESENMKTAYHIWTEQGEN